MDSDCNTPLNIGSTEMVSINRLAEIVMEVAGKKVKINHITENVPLGVRGRNSHNELIKKILGFNPEYSLKEGISHTYKWIKSEINKKPKIKFNFR
jgi:nucleoside-diphosphate-sugar epimerase